MYAAKRFSCGLGSEAFFPTKQFYTTLFALRRSAFDNAGLSEPMRTLISKVAKHANNVIDEDFAAARASGLSEDQIFEMVVSAAIGQATRSTTQLSPPSMRRLRRSESAPRDPR